jgi:hypothetical protein
MGAATAGSATGIKVETNTADTLPSAGAASGGIGSSVTALSVTPSSTALATASVSVIVRFATSATAGDIAAGGTITLGFPTGWFDKSVTPADNAAGSVPTLTATSVIADSSITVTTAVAPIPKATAFTITLTGLKTGPSAVAAGMFSVTTSADYVAAEVAAPALPSSRQASPVDTKNTASAAAASALALLACAIALLL